MGRHAARVQRSYLKSHRLVEKIWQFLEAPPARADFSLRGLMRYIPGLFYDQKVTARPAVGSPNRAMPQEISCLKCLC
jgi:hypothetical protein